MKPEYGPKETVRRLASRTQFLEAHLLVLSGSGPFTEKYLGLVVDAVESQRSTNPEVEALQARLRARVESLRQSAQE